MVEANAESALMLADKRRLDRLVANLVRNAEQHGGGCTGVRVALDEDRVRIEVDDHGPGIPPGQRDRLFDRFARGPDRGSAQGDGVGLGLAIVARHVQWHGGTVSVEDVPGGGARFVVVLPLVTAGSRAHL
jgi:signal transduction histidine kinase